MCLFSNVCHTLELGSGIKTQQIFKLKKKIRFWDMSEGEKERNNFILKYSLLHSFSALKHSDTKDKINLGTFPKFFSCISLFTLGTASQTEVALQAEGKK